MLYVFFLFIEGFMKFKMVLIPAFLLMSGCTSVQTHSYSTAPVVNDSYRAGQRAISGNIQILYSEPRQNYESIGVFSVRKYKPGFSDPTVSDAVEELKEAGRKLGADVGS